MNKYKLLRATFFLLLPLALTAQKASEIAKNADALFESGKIGEAAEMYELAGRLDGENHSLLYKAAEAYYRVRDYKRAAECYVLLKGDYDRYEFAGLRYARALKQNGQYEQALEAFREFGREYRGDRRAQVISVVSNEINGCELALQLVTQRASPVIPAEVKILPKWVNSTENEFSPVPFSDNLLYFSTVVQGQVKLMRTQRQSGLWQQPTEANGLPEAAAYRFGNGVFSPDGNRFYCTQCTEQNTTGRGANGLRTLCALFVLRRSTDGGWGPPVKLRNYINMPDHTVTHPYVIQERGREILYFSSDREGGFGGLDLYVCERPLDTEDLDFSFPQNLGGAINTAGDEVTPFFDPSAQTLWFSSNGQPSVGGLDVFKTVRSDGKWSKPENAGFPVNSPADDFFFTLKRNGSGGFLSSNRLSGTDKTNTRDEDIFEFFPKNPPVTLAGKVLERGSNRLLTDCMVALYETDNSADPRLLEVRPSEDGTFQFYVLPEHRYAMEVTKDGYATAGVQANINDYETVIRLAPLGAGQRPEPILTAQRGLESPGLPDMSPKAVPPGQSEVYRIHLEVQPDFDALTPRYELARNFGKVTAEPLPAQGIIRVILGDFSDQKTANEIAIALRKSGSFPQAFVIREENR
ncbi:MAG: tetratricopeptide repeat protein [Lewinellaceae bacterium]|nr:tetratricopeptide repeat protein [Lewinellaceae bacterium]